MKFRFDGLWDGQRWWEPAYVDLNASGNVERIAEEGDGEGRELVQGYALPGVPNAHSHAFQFAMVGQTEHLAGGKADDDFWSWREAMYALALSVTPERTRDIAAFLYGQMLARGFTSVVEFHYLHHREDGSSYPSSVDQAEALCQAAAVAGIRLTLVPVHYRSGDFDKPLHPRQRRFGFPNADAYLRFAEKCRAAASRYGHRSGGGVHSLRASPPEDCRAVFDGLPRELPRHLHIAEQIKEVERSLEVLGERPVAWALGHLGIDERFFLVHATHVTPDELLGLAASRATVVLCPTTEGNLGDGLFPLLPYLSAGGRIAIGTDSHVGVDPFEELRWLDYGQRLSSHRRNPLCLPGEESGEKLYRAVVEGGSAAAGASQGGLSMGGPLDAVVFHRSHPFLREGRPRHRVSSVVYGPADPLLVSTLVGGRWVSRAGRHLKYENLREAFVRATADRE